MSPRHDIERSGAFTTRRFTIAAGASVQFDADAVQLLITELDGAASLTLQLNRGDEGAAFKGFDAKGRVRHVLARNDNADAVTIEFLLVSPGLVVTDRRLNQVGDLGLVTTFDVLEPVGATTIPAGAVRQVAAADTTRRYLLLTNPPGQFRELYFSGEPIDQPTLGLANGGFETGDFTGWDLISDDDLTIATAATSPTSDPHGGTFYIRGGRATADDVLEQEFDLLALGFSAAAIDGGSMVFDGGMWGLSEDGVSDRVQMEVEFLDGVGGALISALDTGLVLPSPAETWNQFPLAGGVPAGTRAILVRLTLNGNSGGGTASAIDDVTADLDGAGADPDNLAGLIMPAQMVQLPTSGLVEVYNPHTSDQSVLVGQIREG